MREEEKILAGVLFAPGDPELKAIKLRTHNLCAEYNRTFEHETEKRQELISQIFAEFGENGFIQGPMYIHYGKHTQIGHHFFANFNLTIQDDTWVKLWNKFFWRVNWRNSRLVLTGTATRMTVSL